METITRTFDSERKAERFLIKLGYEYKGREVLSAELGGDDVSGWHVTFVLAAGPLGSN